MLLERLTAQSGTTLDALTHAAGDVVATRTLAELVSDRKGARSYERLAQDCGGIPTSKRLQQIATTEHPKTFPDPQTVRGLARGLGVSITTVVLAAAAGLGLADSD